MAMACPKKHSQETKKDARRVTLPNEGMDARLGELLLRLDLEIPEKTFGESSSCVWLFGNPKQK